jgi:hypothetical protein
MNSELPKKVHASLTYQFTGIATIYSVFGCNYMETNKRILKLVSFLLISCITLFSLNARQGTRDTVNQNTNNTGIPNSGNTLQPNNGPEFPHSTFPVQSTDPGPLFHGPSGMMFDSIPNPQHVPH